jgi:Fic family protein
VSRIEQLIIDFLVKSPDASSSEISSVNGANIPLATTKRVLSHLIQQNQVTVTGKGKATRYRLHPSFASLSPIDLDAYFSKEIDERNIRSRFNFDLINHVLPATNLFSEKERSFLQSLHDAFLQKISTLDRTIYNKELERLAIDLSWKSSQIEGNTYSLLETELLLKEQRTAAGKPKDDATMLLNHKKAMEFIVQHPDYVVPLTIRAIEDIHSMLIDNLGVSRNIRQNTVGITGTNYRPLDNEHQIREALSDMCNLVNEKPNVFEKALLTLLLLSYIQPFVDGNKRTARIVSNAVLMAHQHCPISFRTVDAVEYKKAMLVFYEQNNISAFKKIFISQFEFAVNNYF